MPDKLTDSDIVKALECCSSGDTNCCNKCPLDKECGVSIPIMEELMKYALDLINRLQAENEKNKDTIRLLQLALDQKRRKIVRLEEDNQELKEEVKNLEADNERLFRDNQKVLSNWLWGNKKHKTDYLKQLKSEAYKEFANKIDEIFKRYAHLHKYADKARSSKEEYADGTPMEMVSVWEVLSLKKWGMCDYETMNILQDNIENIEKARLLSELEKDYMLLKRELVGDNND